MKIKDLLEDGRIVKGVNTTVDVDTDEIKTQAAKFGNTVDKDGRPPTLSKKVKGASTNVAFNLGLSETIRKQGDKYVIYSKDGKKKLGTYDSRKAAEKRLGQIEYFKHNENVEDQHPNEKPLGPETKPTMPKGSIRVKVSDVYDWYKLGQHISDLKGLGKHDFGKGPPETVISFGSEEEEHKYIELLKKLGLEILDVDPGAADAPGVETDPTYNTENVDEGEFRANDVEEFKPDNKALNNLKSKYLPDWEMLDHRILQAKYVADDHRAAVAFVKIINSLSEQMDHFCEVTQDVAEVTVKTTTFDVKGLTILDFQIAMVIDRFANDVGIKQVPMSGNFGMHENFADGKVKGKSRPGRVKKAGASCSGSVTKLRKQAKNASGEKAKMYHWCANMKSGKKK